MKNRKLNENEIITFELFTNIRKNRLEDALFTGHMKENIGKII